MPSYYLKPDRRFPGAYGDDIAQYQRELRREGLYGGAIDGIYGPFTSKADPFYSGNDYLSPLARPLESPFASSLTRYTTDVGRFKPSTARLPTISSSSSGAISPAFDAVSSLISSQRAYTEQKVRNAGNYAGAVISGAINGDPVGNIPADGGAAPVSGDINQILLKGAGRVSSKFGPRAKPTPTASSNHKGVDISAPMNSPIYTPVGGTVVEARSGVGGFGNWVVIRGDDGKYHTYGHINSWDVQKGQRVNPGMVVARVGNAGDSAGAHLHYEVSDGGYGRGANRLDPIGYYQQRSTPTPGQQAGQRSGQQNGQNIYQIGQPIPVSQINTLGRGFRDRAAADPVARMVEAIAMNETNGRDPYNTIHYDGGTTPVGIGRYGQTIRYWDGFQREAGVSGLNQRDPRAQDLVAYNLVNRYYQQALAAGYRGDEAWKQVAIKWNKGSFGSDANTTNNYGQKALNNFYALR